MRKHSPFNCTRIGAHSACTEQAKAQKSTKITRLRIENASRRRNRRRCA
jgi:hypothetical protein